MAMLDVVGQEVKLFRFLFCISLFTPTSGKYQFGYKQYGELRPSPGFCHFLTLVEHGQSTKVIKVQLNFYATRPWFIQGEKRKVSKSYLSKPIILPKCLILSFSQTQ